jgi:hypothetical protein
MAASTLQSIVLFSNPLVEVDRWCHNHWVTTEWWPHHLVLEIGKGFNGSLNRRQIPLTHQCSQLRFLLNSANSGGRNPEFWQQNPNQIWATQVPTDLMWEASHWGFLRLRRICCRLHRLWVRGVQVHDSWQSNWRDPLPFSFTSFTYFVISSAVTLSLKTTMYRLDNARWSAMNEDWHSRSIKYPSADILFVFLGVLVRTVEGRQWEEIG